MAILINDLKDYEGVDCSLNISLFEYGIAWKEIPVEVFFHNPDITKKKYEFIYGIQYGETEFVKFDKGTMDWYEFLELVAEDSWIVLNDVLNFVGMHKEDWLSTFPHSVSDLLDFYGWENIFGSSYHGFEIKEEEDDNI